MPQTQKQKAIVRRWVKALESGEYRQGIGKLVTRSKIDRFCCLGVLCDMAVRENVIPPPKEVLLPNNAFKVLEYKGRTTGLLPREVIKWAGIKTKYGDFDGSNLTELNDDGASFKTIAKKIKSNPKGLFV